MLERLLKEKPRASFVHVWAPPPARVDAMAKAVAALRGRRVTLRWSLPPFDSGVGAERERRSPVADVVDEAVRARAIATRTRGERLLQKMGVRVVARDRVTPAPREPSAPPVAEKSS